MKKLFAVLLALCLMMTGVSVFAGEEEPVVLNLYDWFDEENYMTAVIDAFNEANPDIKVVGTFSPSTEYAQKLLVALSGGEEIDLWCCNNPSDYASYYEKDQLLPLNDYIDRDELESISLLIDQLGIDGNYCGLPYRKSAWVLYYNKDLFDKKGVAYPTSEWTWDQFTEAARSLSYEEDGVTYYGNMTCPASLGWWRIPALTMGYVNPLEEGVLDAFKAECETTYQLTQEGVQAPYADRVGTAGGDYAGIFLQGETAMMVNGDWTCEMLNASIAEKGIEFNYDICELPFYEGYDPVTVGTPSIVVMNKNTKNADAAYRFMAFLAGEEGATILARAGMIPAFGSDAVTEAIMDKNEVPSNMNAFLSRPVINMAPMDPLYSQAFTIVKEETALYLMDEVSIDTCFETIAQRFADEIE